VPQATLARLVVWQRPYSGWQVTPNETTLRQMLQRVDPDELDRVVGGWVAEQTSPDDTGGDGDDGDDGDGATGGTLPAVAVDGKTLRVPGSPTGTRSSCSPRSSTGTPPCSLSVRCHPRPTRLALAQIS
jgi:hypothetical protein